MHALIVVANPNRSSFSAAVVQKVLNGLAASGHTAEVADLAVEGFDPRMTAGDLAYFQGLQDPSPEIRREQERIERADALVVVHPLYWWQMPALLKGWIDRVFQANWAYGVTADGQVIGLLADRPVRVIVHGEVNAEAADKRGYRSAFLTVVDGIFGFCGIRNHDTTFLFDIYSGEDAVRAEHLEAAYGIGSAIGVREISIKA
ncbi:NAD(P)H-dependent oxidoreductase [Phenylobacterium sp.]|uniref:NAD(P)H-dependent oxidoreductase n=1 Tax=Phenylobacterium sp. TaxID=1871053 RepID=UPI00286AA2CB|nr:NAD(P)H-dependent oxidoreductase [Phenylobacterium sp.]